MQGIHASPDSIRLALRREAVQVLMSLRRDCSYSSGECAKRSRRNLCRILSLVLLAMGSYYLGLERLEYLDNQGSTQREVRRLRVLRLLAGKGRGVGNINEILK